MTFAERYISKARELMPHQDELQNIDPSINDPLVIDELIFAKGEYLGGMAAVILAILKQEAVEQSSTDIS